MMFSPQAPKNPDDVAKALAILAENMHVATDVMARREADARIVAAELIRKALHTNEE